MWEMLDSNITSRFIDKFAICFKRFVFPEKPLLFASDDEED